MKLKQISVPIENSHDRLYELTKALAGKGITPQSPYPGRQGKLRRTSYRGFWFNCRQTGFNAKEYSRTNR